MKPVKKYMIIVAVVAVAALVLWAYLAGRKKLQEKASTDNLTVDGAKLTISDNQAVLIADNLLAAMNRYGTDEQSILVNLNGLSKNDLLLVLKTFGVKPYDTSGFLATTWFQKTFASIDLNLIGWLKKELSGSTLKTVETMFTSNQIPF